MRPYLALMAIIASLATAQAEVVKIGDIVILDAFARATPKGAQVGVGYLTIRNDGAKSDHLNSITADFAQVQMHHMKMTGDVMEMREMTGGLDIPAHATVKFAAGGDHLMFVSLKAPLVKGASVRATLTFEHAGDIAVDFPVLAPGATMKGM